MKKNRTVLIAVAILLLVITGLVIEGIHFKHRDADEYMILDSTDSSERPSDGKNPLLGDEINEGNAVGREDVELERTVEQILNGAAGSWDVWVESLKEPTFATVHLRNGHPMVSASLIKLFIMGTVYQAVEEGRIHNKDVYSDIRSMIALSDNNAANRLIRKLGNGNEQDGMTQINQFAEDIGCRDTQINRLMLANNGLENYTSAKDCARILKLIYSGQCVNKKCSEKMMDCLKQQHVNDRIPLGVPAGTRVAHKTANLTNISNGDVGIVLETNHPYIICIINNDSPDDSATNDQIVALSKAVYDHLQT